MQPGFVNYYSKLRTLSHCACELREHKSSKENNNFNVGANMAHSQATPALTLFQAQQIVFH